MRIRDAAAVTVAGRRSHNEDAVLELPQVPLYAVADGMGGPGGGDHAAGLVLGVLRENADAFAEANERVARSRSTSDRLALGRLIDEVTNLASKEVQREATRLQRPGMASTLVLATVVRNFAYVAHVGDSRAYLVRDGKLSQLTEDHTVAELHFRRGRITRAQYDKSPDRRVLYQALGAGVDVDSDLAEVRLLGSDVLVLCSDGLPRAIDEGQILGCTKPGDAKTSAQRLVDAANRAGAPDNVSAVVLSFEGEPGDETFEAVTEVMRQVALFRDMSPPELLTLAPYLEEVVHDTGETLLAENDPNGAFFVLVAGSVRLTRGRTQLGDARPGAAFGELALGRGGTAGVTARTLVPTRTLVLTRERFHELLRLKPELGARIAIALLDVAGERTRELNDRLWAVERALRGEIR